MKLVLLIILSIAAGIKCAEDAVASSSSKQSTASHVRAEENESCGRRRIKQNELTADGVDPKSGFWPWHVVVTRLGKKVFVPICGGTLVSSSWILTAAHCLTNEGTVLQPYSFRVKLGSYYSYLHQLYDIVVHDDFNNTPLENDIALLKLKSEAGFDDYIQPACVWHDKISEKLSSGDVYGDVVGWVNKEDEPWHILRNATIPMVPEAKCIKSNLELTTKTVDEGKFCAGLGIDTENWYGDIGGGFYVFVPDHSGSTSGAWYVRGILSQSPSTEAASSEPQQYALFTDVAKYDKWIQKHIQ